MEGFHDSSSGHEDLPVTRDEEEFVFVPFINQMI